MTVDYTTHIHEISRNTVGERKITYILILKIWSSEL